MKKLTRVVLLSMALIGSASASHVIDGTMAPRMEKDVCFYDAVLNFPSFPDYDLYKNYGSDTIWTKDAGGTTMYSSVESLADGTFNLHIYGGIDMVIRDHVCKEKKFKVIVR